MKKLFGGKYDVLENGEVYSNVGTRKRLGGKVGSAGYRMLVLTVDGKKLYKNVHRLVAEAFIPNPDALPEVNHKDGNKLNNAVDNLEWVSSKDNSLHARDTGLTSTVKIDMTIANEIRRLYTAGGLRQVDLARMFGLKRTQVGYILKNKRWTI